MRDALVSDANGTRLVDLRVERGRIGSAEGALDAGAPVLEAGGRLVVPGFVETHLHLDRSRLGFEDAEAATGAVAIGTGAGERGGEVEDVYRRAEATLRACIAQGTTRIRAQVALGPAAGTAGLDAVLELARAYAWAVDLEVCALAEGDVAGAEGVGPLARALEKGASVIGGAPRAGADPLGHLDRVFELARAFDVDVEVDLDLGGEPGEALVEEVCRRTDAAGYAGRVTLGRVGPFADAAPERYRALCRRVASAGVAVAALPATDPERATRREPGGPARGTAVLDGLVRAGAACSVATGGVGDSSTPYGDGSLVRMANLYANLCGLAGEAELGRCLELVTARAAAVIGVRDYGIFEGAPADLVLLDATSPAAAVAGLATPLWGMKSGRLTFSRERARLHEPGAS